MRGIFFCIGPSCCRMICMHRVLYNVWTEFCARLPVLFGGCPSFLPSLPIRVMYDIGPLFLSRYSVVSLQWSPVVSVAALPLTFATSAAQCRFWQRVGCCVLLRGVSFWSLGHV